MGFDGLKHVVWLTLTGFAVATNAAAAWNESIQGDLSGNGLAPTNVPMTVGNNLVSGTIGNAGQGVDRDYFTFTVPAGAVLSAIQLLPNTFVSGSASFIAMQAGPQLTVTPSGMGVENLLGFALYGSDQIGTNILPLFNAAGQLPPGTYSVWLQETGGTVEYGLDFQLTSTAPPDGDVPLPPWALGALGLLLLSARARKKRSG